MILVTGGTGLVGSHLLYYLLNSGEKVRAVHRQSSDLLSVKKVFSYFSENVDELFNRIEWYEADITNIPALTEAFSGITHVYHAAAYISFDPKHYYKLKKSNIEGTANIVNLCIQNKIEKICYVSSVATLGNTINDTPINEDTQWNPEEKNSVYAITKYGAEMEIWRGTQEGLRVVVVNPGVILGSGFWKSGSGSIVKTAAKGVPFYPPGGMGIVDVLDVVEAMIRLMNSEKNNEKYILVGHNVSFQELITKLAIKLEVKQPNKQIPKFILNIGTIFDWLSNKLFGTKRKLLKATVRSLYKRNFYSNKKIEEELSFSFRPLEATIARVSRDYCKES